MSITSYNTTYHDDYISSGNSDKNYLRILFKPGYSVQVRELNQLQSALQDQINRLGSSVWKADTAVVGGGTSFLPELYSLTLDLSTGSLNVAGTVLTYDQIAASAKSVAYVGNDLRGEVVGYRKGEGANYTFYYNYTNTGSNGEIVFTEEIANGEGEGESLNGFRLILRPSALGLSNDSILSESALPVVNGLTYISDGVASGLVCEEGVFYTKGSFVAVPRQTYFIDKAELATPLTGYAVLKINEEIVSYFDDLSLLDNANGTPNYSAPGADRYTIDLTLNWISSEDYADSTNSYIKLLVINASRPLEITEAAEYAEIVDILAKRTSEESGNYTVNPFIIGTRETFDGDNLQADYIVVGRRYRIQDLGIDTDWLGLGATSPVIVGSEFVAVKSPGSVSDSVTARVNGGRVSEIAYIHGSYRADELDQIGYDLTTPLKKREAIESAREQYTVTLDPSVAYVDGYRVALDKSLNLTSKKAREQEEVRINTSANIGSYFIGNIQTGNTGGDLPADPQTGSILIAGSTVTSTLPSISTIDTLYNLYAHVNGAPANNTNGGVIIGTCRIRAFEATGGSRSQFRCFVHDIVFNTGTPTADWNARRFDNVDQIVGSNFMFNVTSGALLESTANTALFQLPYPRATAMREITFYAQRQFTGPANGAITLSVDGGRTFTDTSNVSLIVNGQIKVQGTHYTAAMSSDALTLTLTPISSNWTTASYSALVKIAVGNAGSIARVTKSRAIADDITITFASGGANKIYTLKNTDIIRIIEVKTASGKIITDLFTLIDDGQRDTIYTNGRVQYTGGATISETFSIKYEHYGRIGGVTGRDLVMYNVDSYRQNNNSIGTAYDDIPSYKGIKLSDALDFRQDILYSVSGGVVGTIITNSNKSQVDPNTPVSSYTTFYLPRIDVVTVNSNNEFTIINGLSSLTPVEPTVPKNAMTLYTLTVPAYTQNVSDIVKVYIDNRRYTMRDIGAIEKRISNIEYYTSLSLLERSASEKRIFDDAGERFKNGILVDNFIGHGVGDVFNPDYSCSVDKDAGLLRPRYNTHNIDLTINSERTAITGSTSKLVDDGKIRVHDSIITLNYEEVELVSHLKATAHISVHPHVYAKINGHIRLSPSADNWKDTVTRPDLIVTDDSSFDAIKFIAEDPALDILGTDWNNWEREWGGSTSTTARGTFVSGRGIPTTTTTVRNYTETRTGTNTTLGFSYVPKSMGTNVVDTAIIPFIRSRIVYFHATGLKASTQVYPFFEDKNISAYTNQVIGNDSTKFIVPTTINDNSTRIFNNLLSTDLPTPESGYTAYGSALMTDNSGELYGSFIIPNNSSMRFRTGDRTFKLTDDIRNASSETTYAFSKYTASGILETIQETILSTKTPQFTVTPLADARAGSVTTTSTAYHDPLAQSFVISSDNYKTGVFITSIDIYFAQKALFQPVEIYIVTMENGAPTRTVVPYSRVFRNPDQVVVSDNGSLPTNFKFSDPVFLKSDEEYSVIVSSNDGDYRCWYAILGETDIVSGKRIEKQEYLGTFFTSANAYTWTPQQEQDLKFRINRARFFNPANATSASGNIAFRTELHSGVDDIIINNPGAGYGLPPTISFIPDRGTRAEAIIDPITGSISKVRILNRGSGYNVAPTVVVNKATTDPNNPTTIAGLVSKLAEVPVSMFNLRQPKLTFNRTAIDYSIQFRSESPERFEPATNNYLPSSYGNLSSHILSSIQQELQFGPRALITANLVTVDSAISPIIDVDGSSLLTVTNLINGSFTGENSTSGGAAIARYITRKVTLNNASDVLNVFISTNRPTERTDIKVYVKLGFDTSTPDDRIGWQELTPKNPVPISSDPNKYSESEYKIDPNDDFISFQVKVILLSDNIFDIPTVRDFRAIATI
jgi:hypothetical protein